MLLSITGGPDLSLIEASEAAEVVRQAAHPEAEIIFGASVDEDMSEEVWITVIATRFDSAFANRHRRDRRTEPREPRSPDRDAALRPERYSDPSADWRVLTAQPRHGQRRPALRRRRRRDGLDRRPTEPRSIENRVLDVPEFEPEQ